jgi:hypothetical protein
MVDQLFATSGLTVHSWFWGRISLPAFWEESSVARSRMRAFRRGSILFFFPKPIWSSRRCRDSLALWLFHFFIHSFRPFYALSLSPTESVASHGKP